MSDAESDLEVEGSLLGRYLIGRDPGPVAVRRYRDGCGRLFGEAATPEDGRLIGFVRRHPWSLPFLDAACGLTRPKSLLRQKLFLMLAVLETIPGHATEFLPAPRARASALLRLTGAGVAAALETL